MTSYVHNMQPVTYWTDAIPFAGSIVAYKTCSAYYASKSNFSFDSLHFGYVHNQVCEWNTGESGYLMTPLLKMNEAPQDCALINSRLVDQIFMRWANRKEVYLVGVAINNQQAALAHFNIHRVKNIAFSHVSKL